MCIVCRQHKTKDTLLKITKSKENKFSFDEKAHGRGAYICLDNSCIDKCIKKRLLNRAFKTNIDNSVYDSLEKEYSRIELQKD